MRTGVPRRESLSVLRPGLVVPVLWVAATLSLAAQTKPGATLCGRVVDRDTGVPVGFANVFLSNTTFGKASDKNGQYVITGVPAGSYQVVASCVGYEVGVSTQRCAGSESLRVDFALRPRALPQDEIQVEARDPSRWRDMYEEFQEQFIGTSRFSSLCKVLNPWVVNLDISEGTQILWGATDSTIRIENRALGYRLFVLLDTFEYNRTTDALRYLVYPRFEEMTPHDKEEDERWQSNREESYRGSCRHFFKALFEGRTEEEGFSVHSGSFQRLQNEGGYSLGTEDLREMVQAGLGLYRQLWFTGYLRVDYRGRKNYIRLEDQAVSFDASGNFLEPFALTALTQSAWAEDRMARLLPNNYESRAGQ
jgi:hypothetical protein